jgi:hypothetical protein
MKSIFGQKEMMLLGVNVLVTLALVAGFTLSTNQGAIGSQGPSGSQGLPGSNGLPGEPGEDGETPYIGINGNWWIVLKIKKPLTKSGFKVLFQDN